MPFEKIRKILGKERILNWNHDDHPGIVWRFPDPSSQNELEKDTKKIDAFQVKIGERAISLINNEFYEDTPPGVYWLNGEQKKGLEVIYVDQGQIKQPWGIPGTILTKDDQSLGAHGFYMFRIIDPKNFVLSIISAQRVYSSEQVNDFIRGYIADVLRQHLTNYTVLDGQILRQREELVRGARTKCQELFGRWGLELINMETELHIPKDLQDTIQQSQEIRRYKLTKSVGQQRLEIDRDFDLLKIDVDKNRELNEYEAKREIEVAKRQFGVISKESEIMLKNMDVEMSKLESELYKIATETKSFNTERIAQAEALRVELEERAKIAGELLSRITETDLKVKEIDAEYKGKSGLSQIDAWKEVEKAKAEAQRKILEEENKLRSLKEIGEVLAKMAEAVAIGGVKGEAMRMRLEQKFVTLLHQIGVDVPEYEEAKKSGKISQSKIKIEAKHKKDKGMKFCSSCGRELEKDAKYCDNCGKKQ